MKAHTRELALGAELPNLARDLDAGTLVGILDEAECGDTRRLMALYRDILCDSHVQAEYLKRKAAILADSATLLSARAHNSADEAAVAFLKPLVDDRLFLTCCSALLDGAFFPVSVVEKVYRPRGNGFEIADLIPVPMQLLDFRSGTLRIFDTDASGRILSTSHAPDPMRYIVHRAGLLPLPDRWGGALRAVLFWWLLRTMSRQWWAGLLERFGTPFLVGKAADKDDRDILSRAFALAVRLGGVVVSKATEVEIAQAAQNDSGASHGSFIELCNAEISKLIVGQTLSSTPAATGMGSGVAQLQGEVRDDLRRMDARLLATTLRDQLFEPLLRLNGIIAPAPLLRFGADSAADRAVTVSLLGALSTAGLELEDEGITKLSEQTGLPLRRKEPAPAMPGMVGLSAPAAPKIRAARRLEALYAEEGEILTAIIEGAASAEDAERQLRAWLTRRRPDAADLLADILERAADAGAL